MNARQTTMNTCQATHPFHLVLGLVMNPLAARWIHQATRGDCLYFSCVLWNFLCCEFPVKLLCLVHA